MGSFRVGERVRSRYPRNEAPGWVPGRTYAAQLQHYDDPDHGWNVMFTPDSPHQELHTGIPTEWLRKLKSK